MDARSYKWFLQELCNSHTSIKILETGVCRGTKVTGWFSNCQADEITSKSEKLVGKTRYLINYFLSQRVPILEEYAPDKIICYLYHKTGKKLVTAKEAIELAENQLHGLQVTSIHMAINSTPEIYSLSAYGVGAELNTEIFVNKFGKNSSQVLKDSVVIEKIIHLLVQISDLIMKFSHKDLHHIEADLILDPVGSLVLINISQIVLKDLAFRSGIVKKSSVKVVQQESSSDETFEQEESPQLSRLAINSIFEKDKKNNGFKIAINKALPNNSQPFLQMIANTIDKERKKQDRVEILDLARKSLKEANKGESSKLMHYMSTKSYRNSRTIKSLDTLEDLLFYVEKTRPRVWVKDRLEVPATVKNSKSGAFIGGRASGTIHRLKETSHKSHLSALLADENRIGRRLMLRSNIASRRDNKSL